MTDEQINAAIDQIMDYPWVSHGCDVCRNNELCRNNYSTDLNAMHEAERSLHEPLREMYVHELLAKVADSPTYLWDVLTAHPRSRAEAFLRTLGKWEEAAK
jgi:hypothetical protein